MKIRKQGLDKFYTKQECSKMVHKVFELYKQSTFDLIVEPSAGNGSFYKQIDFDNKNRN